MFAAELKDGYNRAGSNSSGIVFNTTNSNSNNNNNENINTNNINLEIEFEIAREKIENDESITEELRKEVLSKINEIEDISKSSDPKNKKWFKLRPTMEWLGKTGVGIATSILNLITAILKMK